MEGSSHLKGNGDDSYQFMKEVVPRFYILHGTKNQNHFGGRVAGNQCSAVVAWAMAHSFSKPIGIWTTVDIDPSLWSGTKYYKQLGRNGYLTVSQVVGKIPVYRLARGVILTDGPSQIPKSYEAQQHVGLEVCQPGILQEPITTTCEESGYETMCRKCEWPILDELAECEYCDAPIHESCKVYQLSDSQALLDTCGAHVFNPFSS